MKRKHECYSNGIYAVKPFMVLGSYGVLLPRTGSVSYRECSDRRCIFARDIAVSPAFLHIPRPPVTFPTSHSPPYLKARRRPIPLTRCTHERRSERRGATRAPVGRRQASYLHARAHSREEGRMNDKAFGIILPRITMALSHKRTNHPSVHIISRNAHCSVKWGEVQTNKVCSRGVISMPIIVKERMVIFPTGYSFHLPGGKETRTFLGVMGYCGREHSTDSARPQVEEEERIKNDRCPLSICYITSRNNGSLVLQSEVMPRAYHSYIAWGNRFDTVYSF